MYITSSVRAGADGRAAVTCWRTRRPRSQDSEVYVGGGVGVYIYLDTHSLLLLFTTLIYYRLELSSAAAQNTSNHVIILKSIF
jgi:hypothetical protein